ncbi:MAG: hypothetical protein ACE5GX_10585 [Thermoanaerobaculia bacterium]
MAPAALNRTEAQGKTDDAAVVGERFRKAWAEDGHRLTSSRF